MPSAVNAPSPNHWTAREFPYMLLCTSLNFVPSAILSSQKLIKFTLKNVGGGFPGGTVVKNPPANAGDTGSSPGLGGSHMPRSN